MKDEEKKTVDYYDSFAEAWAAGHGGNEGASYWQTEMARFHELLPGRKVLEIGSGAGTDAAALMAMGYDYTGTDASKGLLQVARKRNPTARLLNVTVHDLDFGVEKFDGFWTAATLLHIPKTRIDEALVRIKGVIKPGGVGFISLKQGEGEKTSIETGRWFAYYGEAEFREVLGRSGYKTVEVQVRPGEEDTWLAFFVRT